eukprot:TRINITY_DN12009_c0_g1_i1.p1 TRINITY_DN12009_c0_g1~~TRINITY_DN12009_c0_g1_i1.p1  ORF type:complete len:364 (-),score=81.46 TRINITY_DN12009_c0_g1_i1:108-1199(-)
MNDLITQVKAPGEESDSEEKSVEYNESPPAQQKQAPKRSFCSLFCCGGQDDEDVTVPKHSDVEMGNKTDKKGQTKISISGDSGNDGSFPDRALINSPRNDSGETGKATAPWKDDHLLPPIPESKKGKKCLVLDLDETLVHSSFKPVEGCDFIIPVEIENQVHKVYVSKRPFVDDFMKKCGELFEVVVFTASLAKYADPVLDLLDIHKVVDWRLFRESCSPFKGSYVKDMGRMGRDLNAIMIVDNSPHSYAFNPENAIPVESWFSDLNDTELRDMFPLLEKLADSSVTDCREVLRQLQISGVDALKQFKRELQGDDETDDEYSSSEEYSDSADGGQGDGSSTGEGAPGQNQNGSDSETDEDGSG